MTEPVASIAPIVVKALDDLVRSEFESFRNIWFNRLLISTAVVAVGLLFELPEIWHDSIRAIRDLRHSSTPTPEVSARIKLLISVGWLLIVVGVIGEFVADSFVSKADGIVQTFDETLITDAQRKTGLASERAASAFERAAQTEQEASQENERAAMAEQQAQQENERAAKALDAAETARKEAEGFQLQIAQANERAANAEERTKKAELELARIRTPRSLTNVPELIASLEPFKGTEYTLNVFMDDESMQFAKVVGGALEAAGWVRKQPAGINLGVPTMKIVFDRGVPENVPACINTGISLRAQVKESLEVLQSRSQQSLPKIVQASLALKSAIALSISPPDERNVVSGVVDPNSGEGIPITICVGKKP
jgi:hypothetical protein